MVQECRIVRVVGPVSKPDGRTYSEVIGVKCETHGVALDPLFLEMENAVCPIGHIADVERRFDYTRKEFDQAVRTISERLARIENRLDVLEEAVGIERENLYPQAPDYD